MTSTPPTTLVVSLIVVLVVLFALGIYWLLFRKEHPVQPRPTRPHAAAWPPQPQASEDECEASTPYPEYAIRQAHFANRARQTASAFRDTREPIPDDAHHAQHLPHA